ncbi:tripartite-type tricarboxylate transporter receptor subunit TctC [Rhodopseudomonas thermotolerans]|jgi:tripartite-type tricarboxylate transporter receptor subunit TctC|uniref:Tripartite-type tricarboxylate transporter receptor subunit TctC n=2 Tax=Rhodopseudomonas TaxID=1073 RepID=A0A336JIX2_9BRAD|nr:tripartite-type tricarboxylate transporter receptor subunit TctC [Rhodopseudomonas pentothenatexigens]REG06919.1 tripartite-type tricarboxylate transporter receptor subunit TctC [Rhodopseudomonas thermotolerans]SSW89667.1 tripartite-type tricarboxylate transporter receptor subunit TctC [Rhodopseudomonas pentothenatexigens]
MSLIRRIVLSRRAVLATAVAALAAASAAPPAGYAEGLYPNRPVRIVLPFAAGGVADLTARLIADQLGAKLGQRFYVENQPGAGGIAAARTVIAAQPDGYTLALLSNGTAISVSLFKKLPFDPVKDFAPISSLGTFDFLFAVRADSKFKTLEDFIKAAKQKPGALNVGAINNGSTQNLAAELFKTAAGVDFVIVPYRGTPEVLVALLQGGVDLTIDSYSALKGSLADRKIRALAATGPLRSKITPDVPTLRESGIEASIESWNGLFAPAGTPPAVISALNTALQEILVDPALKKKMLELGIDAKPSTPEQLATRLRTDIEKWRAVIEQAGIERQ